MRAIADPAGTRVVAGPAPGAEPPATAAPGFVAGTPSGPVSTSRGPPGWETLLAQGERMVVATRRLADHDRDLALLARDNVAFASFPADGAVVVVGGDALEAKDKGGVDSALPPGPA